MDEVTFHGVPLLTAAGRVMTPRPATERVVDDAVAMLDGSRARVADVGTGSGAIAIALAMSLPQAEVFATDTSAAAVELARANVRRHGLADRVTVYEGDLLQPVPRPLDLIVANLPYLPLAEASRRPELADEPREAVFAPGDGLDPYRRLIAASLGHLRDGGALVIQFHRHAIAATRDDLDLLASALAAPTKRHLPERRHVVPGDDPVHKMISASIRSQS